MTSLQPLFERSEFVPAEGSAEDDPPAGRPRLRLAVRDQVVMRCAALDELLPAEHAARSLWAYVSRLDLSPLLAHVKAVEGHTGRPPTDPRILLTLWLYATVEGIGSARELARWCETDAADQWIAGGVSLNHHTLADFRACQGPLLDRLLTQSVASLMAANRGRSEPGGSGRDAGAGQRRRQDVPPPREAGRISRRGEGAGRAVEGRTRRG